MGQDRREVGKQWKDRHTVRTSRRLVSNLLPIFFIMSTVAPRYNAPRYYADSDITRSVVDPEFLPPGENVKWAHLNVLRIALIILKKH